jgi:hypothetical protein
VLFKDVIAASTSSYEENKTNPKQPKLISVTAFIDVENQKQREFAKKVNNTCFDSQKSISFHSYNGVWLRHFLKQFEGDDIGFSSTNEFNSFFLAFDKACTTTLADLSPADGCFYLSHPLLLTLF